MNQTLSWYDKLWEPFKVRAARYQEAWYPFQLPYIEAALVLATGVKEKGAEE